MAALAVRRAVGGRNAQECLERGERAGGFGPAARDGLILGRLAALGLVALTDPKGAVAVTPRRVATSLSMDVPAAKRRGTVALVVQAGTATSTRGRGEVNSFNVIRIERE